MYCNIFSDTVLLSHCIILFSHVLYYCTGLVQQTTHAGLRKLNYLCYFVLYYYLLYWIISHVLHFVRMYCSPADDAMLQVLYYFILMYFTPADDTMLQVLYYHLRYCILVLFSVQQTTLGRLRKQFQAWEFPPDSLDMSSSEPYLALPHPLTDTLLYYPNLRSLTHCKDLAIHTPCKDPRGNFVCRGWI